MIWCAEPLGCRLPSSVSSSSPLSFPAAEIATAFSAAAKDRLDLSVGIALGSAAQIALFVAPLLVILSYVMFWPGAIVMMLIATIAATLMTRRALRWFVGAMILMVYATFAMTLFLLPPAA